MLKVKLFSLLTGGKYPVIDNVVGGLILAAILFVLAAAASWINTNYSIFTRFIENLITPTTFTLPLIYFLILSTVTIVLAICLAYILIQKVKRTPQEIYREDVFDDVIWRWGPSTSKPENVYPLAYCPYDDNQLVLPEDGNFWICPTCLNEVEDIRPKVRSEIGRRVRDSTWKGANRRIKQLRSRSGNSQSKINNKLLKVGNE